MNLKDFDVIVVNTSAGKDSQAMMDKVVNQAKADGILDRVHAVHCDLGRMEWQGTTELVREQAAAYNIPLHIVRREKGDLLDHAEARGMWPSSKARYCTSDHKRDQAAKIIRKLANEAAARKGGPVRILNCMGIRAQESSARAKKNPISIDKRISTKDREVTIWFPIFDWTEVQVWATIKASGVRHHRAYDLGMPRLSCAFCIFAPKAALMIAGKHNPELLDAYCEVEEKIGHTFKKGFRIGEIQEALAAAEQAGEVQNWNM
jgi:3'-phosphoadenosine 5'-phosphosulfate sulfotransferase (PAPS reductase)/FAD synthetase